MNSEVFNQPGKPHKLIRALLYINYATVFSNYLKGSTRLVKSISEMKDLDNACILM